MACRTAPVASPETVAPALLAWAQGNGRHNLPWQLDVTPYRVWVSEVMLQQTQVATVISYFERFVFRFPDVASLSAAPLDEVLHLWTGLGYYARARNLQRAARIVVEQHEGCLPDDIETLQTLPGIGRSTAGAILALARGQRHAILDGNARRVLSRLFAVEGDPGAANTLKRLWILANACTPVANVPQYTQAIMDLGAGVCLRSRPRCEACPLSDVCVAHLESREHELPSRRRRALRPRRTAYALVIRDAAGALLLQRRPVESLWGGLWSFPQFDSEAEAAAWLAACLPNAVFESGPLPTQHHSFTHYDLTLHPRAVRLEASQPATAACAWYDAHTPARLGLTKAVTQELETLCQLATNSTLR
ncbi:MAG TPA: A/G-specific adenine glycosylase [Dehalococcoidia bacterium]|nr:A/G-specific adenine glycosylase [Dehalococcoidia bacterium]